MNAVGLRDQLIGAYGRVDQGRDGLVRSAFLFQAQWWGRLDEGSAAVQSMQDRLQMKLDAVAEFADEAVIPVGGMLKDTTTGSAWWVRGINSQRLLRRVVVGLERISDEQFAEFSVYDRPSQLDGAHLITGA